MLRSNRKLENFLFKLNHIKLHWMRQDWRITPTEQTFRRIFDLLKAAISQKLEEFSKLGVVTGDPRSDRTLSEKALPWRGSSEEGSTAMTPDKVTKGHLNKGRRWPELHWKTRRRSEAGATWPPWASPGSFVRVSSYDRMSYILFLLFSTKAGVRMFI